MITIAKVEEGSNGSASLDAEASEAVTHLEDGTEYQTTVMPAHIQLGAGDVGLQGVQTLTMSNSNTAVSNQAATIVQYATQGPDGQILIPVSNLSSAGGQTYQIVSPSSLPGGIVMATTTASTLPTAASPAMDEAARKRELRLLKNSDAARECRRKKKEYVKCLENRVAVLENQNKALIEELKSLKELYCQKDG